MQTSIISSLNSMMTFDVILEHFMDQTLSFVTVEDCKDMSDCIDHINSEFSGWNIEQIKEVN
jgi:hypothetical protein